MSDETAVWIVVAVVVLVVMAVGVALVLKRGREAKARRADEMRSVCRHVLGACHVHAATLHLTRHSRIWLSAELFTRDFRHLLDCIENDLRSY